MLCPKCGTYATDEEIVCRRCGKLLERGSGDSEDLMSFRQGRHLRNKQTAIEPPREQHGSSGASRSFEDTTPPPVRESSAAIYGERDVLSETGRILGVGPDIPLAPTSASRPTVARQHARTSRVQRSMQHQRMVNWAHVLIGCGVMVILLIVGAYLYLTRTPGGQVIMARMGQEASSAALWQVGEEYMNTGDIERAVDYFTRARELDGEDNVNVSGLLMLGSAYEADGNLTMAEEVYAYVYTEVVPSAPEAYRNQARVLLAMGRDADAAAVLQLAYQNTGVASFRTQRSELLPSVPQASVIAGYYTEKKTVELLQAEDYDVVYTTDIYAILPDEGVLYTGPLELGEGEHNIRAVAVNGDLVSDEMEASYQIYMPTPLQPDCNLAPGTYNYRVKNLILRPGTLTDEELEKNPGYEATLDDKVAQTITVYYTIDGSQPDPDSPIFTGEGIELPGGGVTLKAISVNGYMKSSTTFERYFKFDKGPYPESMYSTLKDFIGDMKLGVTTRESFISEYGSGTSMEMVSLSNIDGQCEKYLYPWGHAAFMKVRTGWVLAELYFTTDQFKGPRSTAVGMTEKEITSKFKDFGQVESPSGNRGLYEDEDDKGKIYKQEDGTKIIRYRASTADSLMWQLDYELNTVGTCVAIRWTFEQ